MSDILTGELYHMTVGMIEWMWLARWIVATTWWIGLKCKQILAMLEMLLTLVTGWWWMRVIIARWPPLNHPNSRVLNYLQIRHGLLETWIYHRLYLVHVNVIFCARQCAAKSGSINQMHVISALTRPEITFMRNARCLFNHSSPRAKLANNSLTW